MQNLTNRQKEIIEKAMQLIKIKGIQNFTISNLAEAVAISEPAIYRHFKNKTEILLTIIDIFKQEFESIFIETKKKYKSPLDQIINIYKLLFFKFINNPSLTAVIFSEEIFQNERELSEKVYSLMQKNEKLMISLIKKGQEKNLIRKDIQDIYLSALIMGPIRLLVTKWRISKYSFSLKNKGNTLLKDIKLILTK